MTGWTERPPTALLTLADGTVIEGQGIGATGRNFYYVDPESGICFSNVGPATAADETL